MNLPTPLPKANAQEQALLARIPAFDDPKKTDYLGYRAMGFSVRESCLMVGVQQRQVMHWRGNDPTFKDWETTRILELQDSVAEDLLRLGFNRNLHLNLQLHRTLLMKALIDGVGTLSKNEISILRVVTNAYGPAELAALQKLLGSDSAADSTWQPPQIIVNVDQFVVESESAKRAASRQLLHGHILRPDLIDSEATDVTEQQ